MIWKILIIPVMFCFFISLLILDSEITIKDKNRFPLGFVLTFVSIWLWAFCLFNGSTIERNSKRYIYSEVIKQKFEDGVLVKSDTLFVISPKTKNK